MSKLYLKKTNREKAQIVFFVTILLLAGIFLTSLTRISIPLLVAYIVYLVTHPLVPLIGKFGITKIWSVLIVFTGVLFFAIYPIVKVVPVVTEEARNLQYYIPKIELYIKKKYKNATVYIEEKSGYKLDDKLLEQGLQISRDGSRSFLLNLPKILASLLEWIFVVPLFLFFMLKDGVTLKGYLLRVCPNSFFEKYYYLTYKFNKQIGGYILAKFIEASIVGLIITVGLLVIGVKFSFVLGLIAGLTNIIPYVGPILGMIPAIVLALVEYDISTTFWAIFILYMVANAIDMALVFPILVSKIVDLHPVIVVLSVILGSQYFGILGMIVSIPFAAALKLILFEIFKELYQDS